MPSRRLTLCIVLNSRSASTLTNTQTIMEAREVMIHELVAMGAAACPLFLLSVQFLNFSCRWNVNATWYLLHAIFTFGPTTTVLRHDEAVPG